MTSFQITSTSGTVSNSTPWMNSEQSLETAIFWVIEVDHFIPRLSAGGGRGGKGVEAGGKGVGEGGLGLGKGK